MRVLLDTHIILWAITNSSELSDDARRIISDKNNEIYYSSISIWEVAIKHKLHPDRMIKDGKNVAMACRRAGFKMLSLRDNHVFELELLPLEDHKDPFDRILISQAKHEKMSFLTHDSKICEYNEECIYRV